MRKQYATLITLLTLCILSMGLLACSETSDKDNTSTVTQSATKPGNIQEALKQVVQVLHAPYDKGDLFFRIFKGTDAISDYKNGDESAQIGDSQNNASNTGSGSWTVTAGKDAVTYEAAMWALIAANDGVSAHHRKAAALDAGANVTDFEAADAAALAAVNSIVYTYKDYQPNGSAIKIDGKMLAMHRSKKAAVIGGSDIDIDAIQFNKVGVDTLAVALTKLDGKAGDKAESGGAKQAAKFTANYKEGLYTTVDTLKITGAYKAKLKFTYTATLSDSTVTAANYDAYLFGDEGIFTFTGKDAATIKIKVSKVTFTYKGKTIKLNKEQLKTLLHVA